MSDEIEIDHVWQPDTTTAGGSDLAVQSNLLSELVGVPMVRTPTSLLVQNLEAMIFSLGTAEPDEISRVTNMIKFLGAEARRLESLRKQTLVERIVETGQDIVLSPTIRLYAGTPPKYELRGDGFAFFEALFMAAGGDVRTLFQCLGSDWWSVSKSRSLFEECGQPELFDKHVMTTREPELKEGKPVKKLQEHDTTFTARPRAGITAQQRKGFLK